MDKNAEAASELIEVLKALRTHPDAAYRRPAELMCAAIGGQSKLQDTPDAELQSKVHGLWLEGQRQLLEVCAKSLHDKPEPVATIPHLGVARGASSSVDELAEAMSGMVDFLKAVLPEGLDPQKRAR